MSFLEKDLRKSKLEALERLAKWLGVEPKLGRNDKESLTFLIYAIIRAIKRLERLPKGVIPSDYISRGCKIKFNKENKMDNVNQISENSYTTNECNTGETKTVFKSQTVGLTTLSLDKLQNMENKNNKISLSSEDLQSKREAIHQENMRQRRVRKNIKNKALAVAKSKYDRRRIITGATAQQISNKNVTANTKSRARTIRRETARQNEKLSRKLSTEKAEFSKVELTQTEQ